MDPVILNFGFAVAAGALLMYVVPKLWAKDGQKVERWAAGEVPKAMTAMERFELAAAHPVQAVESIEHSVARAAAEAATKGVAHLIDVSPEDTKIEAANAVKALKAKLATDVLTMLQQPPAPAP